MHTKVFEQHIDDRTGTRMDKIVSQDKREHTKEKECGTSKFNLARRTISRHTKLKKHRGQYFGPQREQKSTQTKKNYTTKIWPADDGKVTYSPCVGTQKQSR
jgi:hypothetical protein